MRWLTGFVLLASLALGLPSSRPAEPTRSDLLEAVERQLKGVHEGAGRAVACVVVSRSDKYPSLEKSTGHPGRLGAFDREAFLKDNPRQVELAHRLDLTDPESIPDHGYAGGVVIDASGLVLVNYHSIDGATKVYVHLPGGTGSYADIHAADARSDLAVLRLLFPPPGLKAARIGEERMYDAAGGRAATVVPGKLVVAMANPYTTGFKLDRPGASLGSVTGLRRRPPPKREGPFRNLVEYPHRSVYKYSPVIEYDARLNVACSGTALLNLDGELIGLGTTTAGIGNGDTSPSYALPLDANMRRIVNTLRRGEEVEYGLLGVVIDRSQGIVLGRVTPRSPAAAANLYPGDRIVEIDGVPSDTYEDLLLHVGSALAGTKVKLSVERGGRRREVEVTLAKFKSDTPFIASVRPEPVFGLRVDYGSVLAQTINDAGRGAGVPHGVMVRELVPESPAAVKFKALAETSPWIITHVNGTPTPTPADFYTAARGKPAVRLTVVDATEGNPRPQEVPLP